MKYFWLAFVATVMSSCASVSSYYQVYEVKSDDVPMRGKNFVFENEDVEVVYDFCKQGGSLSFVCRNKSERTVYISMPNSFFIKNGMAYNYFEEREYTTTCTSMSSYGYGVNSAIGIGVSATGNISGISLNSGTSNMSIMSSSLRNFNTASISRLLSASQTRSVSTGVSSSVTEHTARIIAIPPHSAKIIRSYAISSDYLIQCGEDKHTFDSNFPKRSSSKMNYTAMESPVVFRNHIAYSFDESEKDMKSFDNSFYVCSLQNFAEKEVLAKNKGNLSVKQNPFAQDKPYIIPCDSRAKYTFKITDANTFFNKYDLPKDARYSDGKNYWQ